MFATRTVQRLLSLANVALVFLLTTESFAKDIPLAVSLGPKVMVGKPSGGYVGQMTLTPDHGPIGTPVKVSAKALPPNQEFDLVWQTVKGRWKVQGASYRGREYKPVAYRIATVRSDAQGVLSASFVAPEDFGFSHDVILQKGDRLFTKAAFNIDMTMTISPKSGPVGTPISVVVKGIGWRYLQNSWMLLYDNNFTGWISSVTTGGSAEFTIPATGRPGDHLLEVMHGAFTFPYRNTHQNPMPGQPVFALKFRITSGEPVLPPPLEKQIQTSVRGLPPVGELKTHPRFSGINQPVRVAGNGFKAGKTYELNWTTVTGNRVVGRGWTEDSHVVAKGTADASGNLQFKFKAPDDLGGAHQLWVQDGDRKKEGTYWITPTALPMTADRGPAGTPFTIHLKGVGWTETANIYTIVYDNSYTGYSCGFNSQGDIEIFMKATGDPGWHFIDLYPAIYKGKERKPRNFQIPQLTYKQDHPGEDLPHFRFAFKITEATDTTASR
jgi:hypothetical protein